MVKRNGRSIADATPLVSTLGRASALLRVSLPDLERAVAQAQLTPWGVDAWQCPVWRWGELLEAAAAAGLSVPAKGRHTWRTRPAVRRADPYGKEKW